MSEITRILDRVDRAYRARAWCGASLLEALDGVSAAPAARHPVKGAHSIWELVEHVASWNEIVASRLEGEAPGKVPPEFNFPPVPRATPAAWKASLRRLARSHTRFRKAVAAFPASRLGRKRPGLDHTWSVLISGQVEHVLYHAGQIALLRRGLKRPLGG